ncbi:hypothetical protein U1Q18_049524 [Sarracenia purpurea var. burkii]
MVMRTRSNKRMKRPIHTSLSLNFRVVLRHLRPPPSYATGGPDVREKPQKRRLRENSKMAVGAVACLLTILAIFSIASSIDDKCAACNAVAEELELGLSNVRVQYLFCTVHWSFTFNTFSIDARKNLIPVLWV